MLKPYKNREPWQERLALLLPYWPNVNLSVTVSPFNWLRFEVGGPWMGAEAIWITVGPLDVGLAWGG